MNKFCVSQESWKGHFVVARSDNDENDVDAVGCVVGSRIYAINAVLYSVFVVHSTFFGRYIRHNFLQMCSFSKIETSMDTVF